MSQLSCISAQVGCLYDRQQATSCFVVPVRVEAIVTVFLMAVLGCFDATPSGASHPASERKKKKRGEERGHRTEEGFRPGWPTTDHKNAFQQLRSKAAKSQQTLQFAAVVFKKAFNTVEHSSICRTLCEQGIEEPFLRMLTEASRQTPSDSAHRRYQQAIPPHARLPNRRPAQHASV